MTQPILSPGCSQARQALAAARLDSTSFRFHGRTRDDKALSSYHQFGTALGAPGTWLSLSPPKLSPTSTSPSASFSSLLTAQNMSSLPRSLDSVEHPEHKKNLKTELLEPLIGVTSSASLMGGGKNASRFASGRIAQAANRMAQAASAEAESLRIMLDVHERGMRSVYTRIRSKSVRDLGRPQSATPSKSKSKDDSRASASGTLSATPSEISRCSSSGSYLSSSTGKGGADDSQDEHPFAPNIFSPRQGKRSHPHASLISIIRLQGMRTHMYQTWQILGKDIQASARLTVTPSATPASVRSHPQI